MATEGERLLLAVRAELERVADAARAPQMQRYMKSAMPYHGVAATPFRAACRRVFADVSFESAGAWRAAVLAIWRGARFREERYAAVELAGHRRARPHQTLDALPMYEEMIVSGAWWDLVDALATHRIGDLLRAFPREMRREMLAWSRSPDMWKRRTAILSQIRFKGETDLELLYACIEPSLASREFFLRKAIGWALRQYAWTDPREVARYVRERGDALSGLSRREALKNIGGAGRAPRGGSGR
jgi:3-methyladenine DNA glycosylase AlkD